MQETDPTYGQRPRSGPEAARVTLPIESHPMLEADSGFDDDGIPVIATRTLRRLLYVSIAVLILFLLVLLPPLISANRYQRRIATSIGDSLGRPVHLDSVSLNLLPLPGFILQNFVVGEDPAFGTEPIIRANSVRATLRLSSLWRRRVEFSTISFTEPSVNLVHTSNGKWNIESILIQAAHIETAPTAQRRAGPAPRFPYIEATGARLNLKLDHEKTPVSLTDADFALWVANPQQWQLRLHGHPTRTDTGVSDAGIVQLEGTLGRAASLSQVPIDLQGEWRSAPLGEVTHVLFGRDAGLRGDMTLSAKAKGVVGEAALQTRLQLTDARRADFVPEHTLSVDLECLASATGSFHAFRNVRCSWPPAGSGPPTLAISGSLLDIRHPQSAALGIGTPGISAETLLGWLRVASARVPANVTATGTLTASFSYQPNPGETQPSSLKPGHRHPVSSQAAPASHWTGDLLLADASLINPRSGAASLVTGDIAIRTLAASAPQPRQRKKQTVPSPVPADGFQLLPAFLALGGKDPAVLEGHFDATGYTLHLTGMASTARMLALGAAIPQFGDGLREVLPSNRADGPYRVDLTATRPWGRAQTWADTTSHPARATRR
jgi:hypothetical protein